jgi:hypothetical protein
LVISDAHAGLGENTMALLATLAAEEVAAAELLTA